MPNYPYGSDRKAQNKARTDCVLGYASGGAVRKARGGAARGDTSINITIIPQKDKGPLDGGLGGLPLPPPPGPGPGGPPPMMPPPGGPPMGGLGGPMMKPPGMKKGGAIRKNVGGSVKGFKSGGKTPKKNAGGLMGGVEVSPNGPVPIVRPGMKTGGKVPKMDGGAGGGLGRLEKTTDARRHA